MNVWKIHISIKLAYNFLYCSALRYSAYVLEWRVLCQKYLNTLIAPLPSPPRPDGVSLGSLMNIDMWGCG